MYQSILVDERTSYFGGMCRAHSGRRIDSRSINEVESTITLVDTSIKVLIEKRLIQEVHSGIVLICLIELGSHVDVSCLEICCVLVDIKR